MAGYMFGCPHCSAKLEARDESRAGRVIACPQCNQQLTIPAPPPMGVLLSSPAKPAGSPPPVPAAQIQVNADPGFKRGMSPAKAPVDGESVPAASSSGFDKLAPTSELDTSPQHTIEAGDDVEAYHFTIPEPGEPTPPPRKKKKKSVEPEPEVVEVHPLEDPKYQLLILVVFVGLIVGGWKLYKSGDVKKKVADEAAAAAAQATNAAPPPPAQPGMLPGASLPPPADNGQVPATLPQAPVIPGQLPGAAPSPPPVTTPQPEAGATPTMEQK